MKNQTEKPEDEKEETQFAGFSQELPPVRPSGPRNLNDAPIMCGPAFGCENKWFRINAAVKAEDITEIVIYDTIGKDWWSDKGVEASAFAEELKKIPRNQEILVRVNSPGGSVADGLLIYNLLAERRQHVVTQVDSLAASIASVIILAGREVRIPRNGRVMVHNPWTYAEGDARQMRKVADKLDVHRDSIAVIYQQKTGRKLDEIHQWMDDETWMTGDTAKEHGFADVVTDEEPDFKACSTFDFSGFRKVPEQLRKPKQEPENSMNRDLIIAELKKLSVTFNADATDEELQALLDTAKADAKNKTKGKAKAKAPAQAAADDTPEPEPEPEPEPSAPSAAVRNRVAQPDPAIENRLKAIEAQNKQIQAKYDAERKQRIEAAVDQCINEDRTPASQRDRWVTRALADETVLDDLRAMPPRPPGSEPASLIVTDEDPQAVAKGILNLRKPLEHWRKGNSVDPRELSNHAKAIAMAIAKNRTRLTDVLNANTVDTELKRNVILNDLMRDFKRVLLMLNVFTTKFENVPLEGTNKVTVPWYDLDTTASTDWNAANGYVFAENTTVGYREVTVNKRKYKPMDFTSDVFRRQPYFNPAQSMRLKVEQLAVDVWEDILSVITEANYGAAALTLEAGTMDTDDLIGLRKIANQTDWPIVGRAAVLNSDDEASLLSDDTIKHVDKSGSNAALRDGSTGRLFGFDMYYSPRIPDNDEDLSGFICLTPAALVATAPIAPAPGVRQNLLSYDIVTDPDTGISFEYRYWGAAQADKDYEVVECNYGFGKGNARALKRISSGSNQFSSSSSQSSDSSSGA